MTTTSKFMTLMCYMEQCRHEQHHQWDVFLHDRLLGRRRGSELPPAEYGELEELQRGRQRRAEEEALSRRPQYFQQVCSALLQLLLQLLCYRCVVLQVVFVAFKCGNKVDSFTFSLGGRCLYLNFDWIFDFLQFHCLLAFISVSRTRRNKN